MQHDEDRQLARIQADLVREFSAGSSEQVVAEQFRALVQQFAGAPVRAFVSVLAQRAARQCLREISRG